MHRFRLILAIAVAIILLVLPPLLSIYSNRYVEWVLGSFCVAFVAITSASRSRWWGGQRGASIDDFDEWENTNPPADLWSGCWAGTVRLYPSGSTASLRLYPLRFQVADGLPEARIVKTGRGSSGGRVTAVMLLASDPDAGEIDLRVELSEFGQRERHTAALRLREGRLVSEDESSPLTLELRPQVPSSLLATKPTNH